MRVFSALQYTVGLYLRMSIKFRLPELRAPPMQSSPAGGVLGHRGNRANAMRTSRRSMCRQFDGHLRCRLLAESIRSGICRIQSM